VFYVQERVGKNGRPFRVIKFRTMVRDAERRGPRWALENDPRVTAVGKWLRKTRIDEWPQLWNVLRGEMSVIGPRPERKHFTRKLSRANPVYSLRFALKPGLTGWAQVHYPYAASEGDALEKLEYDLYYLKNMSFVLDILILLKTVKIVLFRSGR
jgi:lipopolysaccharide/colanic/teichoic acid biosynthesis glycosyltransferase